MKKLIASLFVSLTTFLSSAACDENCSMRLQNAEKGFHDRWQEFEGNAQPFSLWSSDWTEEELKSRFDQMKKERCQIYFTNPDDLPEKEGHYRAAYETPASFKSWGSRCSYPGAFRYNLASDSYNASIITLHGKQFLALEAPTAENCSTFMQVLKDYQATDLVRLTPAVSHDNECSFPYWEGPLGLQNNQKTIELNGKELNYFFTDSWENHESIEPETLAKLVKAVMKPDDSAQMIAVHCRAGVGRTGTFLAAMALISDIDSQLANGVDIDNIQISIDQVFWELSLQRPFMLCQYSQYQTLYRLANWYVDSIKTAQSVSTVGSFPNFAGKWNKPSLMTPQRAVAYHQNLNLLPTCPPPKTVIFCYSKGLMERVLENNPMRPCDGKLKELYFFEEHPDVAIVYYGQGAPSNAMRLEYLLSWGVKQCISIGLAGGLQKDLIPGDLIVCDRAIRDEGVSHHYRPPEKYAYPSQQWTDKLCQTLGDLKIPYRLGASWTTDAFYRQTKEEIEQYQKEGVLTVEMEAAALFTIAAEHQAQIISFFTISDTIGDLEWKPDFENSLVRENLDNLVKIALIAASPKPVPNEVVESAPALSEIADVPESIEIAPYDPEWPQVFENEAAPIQQVLGDNCVAVHHFGSTAVPGLSAKPKIDILAVVNQLESIDTAALEKLGFESRGEVIPTGRYFSKDSPRVHLHIFEEGNPVIQRNLMFRDWLRAHEEDRDAYGALKMQLASVHNDGMSYCRAKTEFIDQIIAKAETASQNEQ